MSRYDLTDFERGVIETLFPKPQGVPRVNDGCVLNGIFWVLRSARCGETCWIAVAHAPPATNVLCARGRQASGMDAVAVTNDGDIGMIDSTPTWGLASADRSLMP